MPQQDFDPQDLGSILSMLDNAKFKCTGCNSLGTPDKEYYNKVSSALKLKAKNLSK